MHDTEAPTMTDKERAEKAERQLFEVGIQLAAAQAVIARMRATLDVGLSVHTYDKRATKLKEALKDAVAERSIEVEELFEIDQAREGRG